MARIINTATISPGDLDRQLTDVEERLKFWRDLNDYAVSQRGEGARREFKSEIEGAPKCG